MTGGDFGIRPLRRFDVELQTFFRGVVGGEVDLSDPGNALNVRRALREVVHAYKKDTVESNASSILYDTPQKRAAYVLKHCACFASAVARHFLRLLRSNPSALRPALRRRRLDVCCLGGGPGTEAVALAKVIGEWMRRETDHRPPIIETGSSKLEIVVSVLDVSGHWRSTVESVVRALNRSGTFFDRERVEVRLAGILETDLTDVPWEERVRKAMSGADLVTMVYFVSAVNGGGAWRRCAHTCKEIAASLKPGGLLFFLDSAKDLHYGVVGNAACQNGNNDPALTLVHGPHLQEFHALSGESIRKYVELYGHFFLRSGLLCLTHCFVACAAWIRPEEESEVPPGPPFHPRMSGREWRKLQKSNTRKREVFLRWLERWLLSELDLDFVIDDDPGEQDPSNSPSSFGSQRTLYATKSKQKRIFNSS